MTTGKALGHSVFTGKCSRCNLKIAYNWTEKDMKDFYSYMKSASKVYDNRLKYADKNYKDVYYFKAIAACSEIENYLKRAKEISDRNQDLNYLESKDGSTVDSMKTLLQKAMAEVTEAKKKIEKENQNDNYLSTLSMQSSVMSPTTTCLVMCLHLTIYLGAFDSI